MRTKLSMVGFVLGLVVIAGLFSQDSARANHAVHDNHYYWEQWAYLPLTSVNAYDCVTQDAGITGAANEWNATGIVSVQTLVGNCNYTAGGVTWRPGSSGCGSYVDGNSLQLQSGVLDPDPGSPSTFYKALHVDIYLGPTCPANGETTCAGYFTPCDVTTHEMGHVHGLADHYTHDVNGNPNCCFTYGAQGTSIMDYPHVTTIAPHDTADLTNLYRIAPFNEYPVNVSALNFHRMSISFGDRSHNERNNFVEEKPYGGSFSYVGDAGKNGTSFSKEVSSPGFNYCYRLRPRNDWGGHGAYTPEYCRTTPHAVQSVAGAFGGGSNYSICWSPVISGSGVSYFKIIRQRWNGGSMVSNISTVNPNSSCYGSVLYSGSALASDWHHFAVRGCDSANVCSNYWDMLSPNSYWVYLPCTGNNSNCSYSSTTSSWYHAH